MRNLELLNLVELCPLKDVRDCQCMTVDCDTGIVYCATSTHIIGLDPRDGQVIITLISSLACMIKKLK